MENGLSLFRIQSIQIILKFHELVYNYLLVFRILDSGINLCYTIIINILRIQLNKARIILDSLGDFFKDWTTVLAVVFITALTLLNASINFAEKHPSRFRLPDFFNVLRFTATPSLEKVIAFHLSSFSSSNPPEIELAETALETQFIIDRGAAVSVNNPLSNVVATREGVIIYKVQKGDTLSRIAANFGISLNTILWANEKLKRGYLQPGEEIVVLPVSGVLHEVREEETLETISDAYGISVSRILNSNPTLIPAKLTAGGTVIVPDSKPLPASRLASLIRLPDLPGYFSIPTTGWNWGRLHNTNAVDIANVCGTPIYAAAEGLVVESAGGWNGGYGNYIVIEHPNSTKTLYAHNQKNIVSLGDYVSRGDSIGYIGNTGNTHGPTGCHVHFEVRGARNPFAN